jgi:hypothetical protein
MANKRLTKKVSKLEKQAEDLRKKAEKKAGACRTRRTSASTT